MPTYFSQAIRDNISRALERNRLNPPQLRHYQPNNYGPEELELENLLPRPRPPPVRFPDIDRPTITPEGEEQPLLPRPPENPLPLPTNLANVVGDHIFGNIGIYGPIAVIAGTAAATLGTQKLGELVNNMSSSSSDGMTHVKGPKLPPRVVAKYKVTRDSDGNITKSKGWTLPDPGADTINVDKDHPMDVESIASNDAVHDNVPLIGGLKRKADSSNEPDEIKRIKTEAPDTPNIFGMPSNHPLFLKPVDFRKRGWDYKASLAKRGTFTNVRVLNPWLNTFNNVDPISGNQLRIDEILLNINHRTEDKTFWCPDYRIAYALVYDIAPTGVTPTYADIMDAYQTGIYLPETMSLNPTNERRFTILLQGHADLPAVPIENRVSADQTNIKRQYTQTRHLFKCNLPVHLTGVQPFADNDIIHGALYWVQCQSNSDPASTGWETSVAIRTRFFDRSFNH